MLNQIGLRIICYGGLNLKSWKKHCDSLLKKLYFFDAERYVFCFFKETELGLKPAKTPFFFNSILTFGFSILGFKLRAGIDMVIPRSERQVFTPINSSNLHACFKEDP